MFGHALNTVNKIRPGSQKPPSGARLALYGLYKQALEGDVVDIADRPTAKGNTPSSDVKREQDKYDAWKSNEGLSRTEAKRRYIEKLIDTMHKYASTTPEARELVEELEFVWDQIKNNSQHSSSEHSSPLRNFDRPEYLHNEDNAGVTASTAALDSSGPNRGKKMTVLSPVSMPDDDDVADDGAEEFVDAPISQVDDADLNAQSDSGHDINRFSLRRPTHAPNDNRWRKRIESTLMKLTTEVAALREQLESSKYLSYRRKHGWVGVLLRIGWWGVQLLAADAVILWIVILYLRRKDDRRLEGAIRVLLGDAVAQVQSLGRDVKMPTLPRMRKTKE